MTHHGLDRGNSQRIRILVLAPTGRDGRAACALIEQAGFAAKSCSGIAELRTEIETGAGAAVIAEEAFLGLDLAGLFEWVEKQPPWSDFPFIVLTTHRDDSRHRQYTLRLIANLRNVTLQERPIQTVTLVSAVQAALRARLRQYETAKYLAEREQAASRLEQLVGERTRQLQEANNRLTAAQESLTMALEAAQMRTWHLDLAEYRIEGSAKRNPPSDPVSVLASWSSAIGDHLLPEDQQAFEVAFDQACGTGKFHLEIRILRDNEETRWVVAEGRLYRDEQGNPIRLAGTIRGSMPKCGAVPERGGARIRGMLAAEQGGKLAG